MKRRIGIGDGNDTTDGITDGCRKRKTVAIIGSGMAGLVTAYLLHRDPNKRYNVCVFEQVGCHSKLLF